VQPARFIRQLRQLEEIGLWIGHIALAQVFHSIDQVRRMALVAGNAVARVFGFAEEILHLAGGVAAEAMRGVLLGAAVEREDRMLF